MSYSISDDCDGSGCRGCSNNKLRDRCGSRNRKSDSSISNISNQIFIILKVEKKKQMLVRLLCRILPKYAPL